MEALRSLCCLIAPSHDNRLPDPETDEVSAVFYCCQNSDVDDLRVDGRLALETRILVVDNGQLDRRRLRDLRIDAVASELDLLNLIIDIVVDNDPDIIVGWEVQKASWGFLKARAATYGL